MLFGDEFSEQYQYQCTKKKRKNTKFALIWCKLKDRAERHDLKSRLWLFFPLFSSLLKKEGRRKWEWIVKIVILSHTFLHDQVKSKFNSHFGWDIRGCLLHNFTICNGIGSITAYIQLAKILLVPPKWKMIKVLSDISILDFSLLLPIQLSLFLLCYRKIYRS